MSEILNEAEVKDLSEIHGEMILLNHPQYPLTLKMLCDSHEKLRRECRHPGCCCVCGHEGKCPEDGPTAGLSDAITD